MNPIWFAGSTAYTMAKYGMSMCVLGMAEEFLKQGLGVNALWPKTIINTAALRLVLLDQTLLVELAFKRTLKLLHHWDHMQ